MTNGSAEDDWGSSAQIAGRTTSLSLQEQRKLAEVENRDEHEEADEERRRDVLNYSLRFEA